MCDVTTTTPDDDDELVSLVAQSEETGSAPLISEEEASEAGDAQSETHDKRGKEREESQDLAQGEKDGRVNDKGENADKEYKYGAERDLAFGGRGSQGCGLVRHLPVIAMTITALGILYVIDNQLKELGQAEQAKIKATLVIEKLKTQTAMDDIELARQKVAAEVKMAMIQNESAMEVEHSERIKMKYQAEVIKTLLTPVKEVTITQKTGMFSSETSTTETYYNRPQEYVRVIVSLLFPKRKGDQGRECGRL